MRDGENDWRNCDYEIKEQDRFLPIANVARVMKGALPERAKLSKESKVTVQECVSEFISFITSQAAEKCNLEKRKTINGEDVLWSMYTLGFETYAEMLKIYLVKYRHYEQIEAQKKVPKKGTRPSVKSEQYYDSEISGSEEFTPSEGSFVGSPVPQDLLNVAESNNSDMKLQYQISGQQKMRETSISSFIDIP